MAGESFLNATAWTLDSDGFLVHTPEGGDITAPDRPSCELAAVTDTTAAFNLTPPDDADFDHYEAVLNEQGSLEETDYPAFTGALTGLTPGTSYDLTVTAVDTSSNRSKQCANVRFKTQGFASGSYQFRSAVYLDEDTTAWADQNNNAELDLHRQKVAGRALEMAALLEFQEVGQDLYFLGWSVEAELMERRADG